MTAYLLLRCNVPLFLGHEWGVSCLVTIISMAKIDFSSVNGEKITQILHSWIINISSSPSQPGLTLTGQDNTSIAT
jgi:hypothetical protein